MIRHDDRGLSTTVGYVLGLAIMLLLSTGLFITGGDFVNDQRDEAIRSELQVVGQQVANDLSRLDRTVDGSAPFGGGPAATIAVTERVPQKVAGYSYDIEIQDPAAPGVPHLLLSTQNPDIEVRVNVTANNDLSPSVIDGGEYTIEFDQSTGTLEVIDD